MMASRNIPIIILGTIAIRCHQREGMIVYNGMLEATINTAKASVADKLQAARTSLAQSKATIEAETAAVSERNARRRGPTLLSKRRRLPTKMPPMLNVLKRQRQQKQAPNPK